jgi:hypothetical protein
MNYPMPILENLIVVSRSRSAISFMELELRVLCSQEPTFLATFYYHPCISTQVLEIFLFHSGFQTKTFYAFLIISCVLRSRVFSVV